MFLKAAKKNGFCLSMYAVPATRYERAHALVIVSALAGAVQFERVKFPTRRAMRRWVSMFSKTKDSYR